MSVIYEKPKRGRRTYTSTPEGVGTSPISPPGERFCFSSSGGSNLSRRRKRGSERERFKCVVKAWAGDPLLLSAPCEGRDFRYLSGKGKGKAREKGKARLSLRVYTFP